jgi:DHA3 family tetracycline resistance protein-like MFS transporter
LWEAHLWIDRELRDSQDAGLFVLALIGGVATALSVAALSLSRRWVEGESDRVLARTAVVLTLAIAAGCMAFGLAPGIYVAIAAYWAVRIARNVLDPTITVWVVRHADPQYRATVLSMEGQSHSVGEISAGPLVGYIGRVITVPAALVTSAIMQALAVPLLAREALRAPAEPPVLPTRMDPLAPPLQPPGTEPTATDL